MRPGIIWFKSDHARAAGLLLLLVIAVYSSSFDAGFTNDSRDRILGDPRVATINGHNIVLILTQNYWWPTAFGNLYRPVTTLSYLFNGSVLPSRDEAAGYRIVNLLLHAGNALLLYLLVLRLVGGYWPAVLTAALWAVHPIATEGVTYLVGRADELAATAVLGSMLVHDRLVRGPSSRIWQAALMLITLAGLLAKENAAVIPATVLLLDVCLRRAKFSVLDLRTRYLLFLPPFLLAGYLRAIALGHGGPIENPFVDNPLRAASFLSSRLTAIKIVGKYLCLLIWPASLSCDYSYNQIPVVDLRFSRWEDWKAVTALASIAVLAGSAIVLFRRCRPGFFFLVFSALTLLPVSNLFFPIGTIAGERLLYLPSIGFSGCLVVAVYAAMERFRLKPSIAIAALVLVAMTWGTRTWLRNLDWKSKETIWQAAVKVAPDSYKAHMVLAESWLFASGFANGPARSINEQITEAEAAMNIVVGLPDEQSPNAIYALLGELYREKGDLSATTAEGHEWYERARVVLSRGATIDHKVAEAMRRQQLTRGQRPEEIAPFGMVRLHASLGLTYLRLGHPEDALQAFLYERGLNPVNPEVYKNISAAQLAAGQRDAAIISLMEARALAGSDFETEDIRKLYDQPGRSNCALTSAPVPALNSSCPLVHGHICAAFVDLTVSLLKVRAEELATPIEERAVVRYGCPADAFGKRPNTSGLHYKAEH